MKKGYTYIFTIILISLVLIIAFGVSTKLKTYSLYKNGVIKLQNHYDAFSLLNVYLTKDEFYNDCKKFYDSSEVDRNINYYGISGRLRFYNDESIFNEGARVVIKTKTNNIENESIAKINIVNEIYSKKRGKKQVPILNLNTIKDDELSLIDEICREIYKKETDSKIVNLNGGIYYAKRERSTMVITTENGDVVDFIDIYKPFVLNGEEATLVFKDNFRIEALINLKEIVLNTSLSLDGLLFLNSQIVSLNGDNIIVKGLVINRNGISENNLVASYNYKSLRSIRSVLFNYIRPTVYSISHD